MAPTCFSEYSQSGSGASTFQRSLNHCCISSLQINPHLTMAVRFRLPALMREAAAEFAATFILLVSKIGLLNINIYGRD